MKHFDGHRHHGQDRKWHQVERELQRQAYDNPDSSRFMFKAVTAVALGVAFMAFFGQMNSISR
jgi:hypothetical protein